MTRNAPRRRRRFKTWDDVYSPEYLRGLDAVVCTHDHPRAMREGGRYCVDCRGLYARLTQGRLL